MEKRTFQPSFDDERRLLDGKGELTCHKKAFQLTILYCQGKASNDKLSYRVYSSLLGVAIVESV